MCGAGGAMGNGECLPHPRAFTFLKYTKNIVQLSETCLQATWEAPTYDLSSGCLLNERVKHLQGHHCKSLRKARRERGQN